MRKVVSLWLAVSRAKLEHEIQKDVVLPQHDVVVSLVFFYGTVVVATDGRQRLDRGPHHCEMLFSYRDETPHRHLT